jgi:cell division transport system permease protein
MEGNMRLCMADFVAREAVANIRRNALMSLACITTVAVTLGFSAFVVLGFLNLDNMLHRFAQELVIAVYLKMDVKPAARDHVGSLIGRIPHVQKQPVLVSREHAWRAFSASIPNSLRSEVSGNPLPDAYMVRVDAPFHVPGVAKIIARLPEVDKVNAPYLEARRAAAVLRWARMVTNAVILLLTLVSGFLVMNTIRLTLYARRSEIRVMQLVGASNAYIRAPFVLEGMLIGLFGGAIACLCVAGAYPPMLHMLHQVVAFELPLVKPGRQMLPFYAGIEAVGLLVGTFGSVVSLRRFLSPAEHQVRVRSMTAADIEQLAATMPTPDARGSWARSRTRSYPRPGGDGASASDACTEATGPAGQGMPGAVRSADGNSCADEIVHATSEQQGAP